MSQQFPAVDPEGLLEYSVVFTDRSLNHMSRTFQQVMREIAAMLRQVYAADAVAVVPGGGTYGMEAIARQLATGQKCLILRNGWFSYRWTQILEAGGIAESASVFKARRGASGDFAPAPIAEVTAAIAAEKPALVFAPHVETASGLLLPDDYLRAVADAVHAVGGLFVLDCVASGAAWVNMQTSGVDVLLSAPQKGWSATPCAGLVMLSAAAKARVLETTSSSFALDLKKWLQIMQAYENGGHAYHATLPTDGLVTFHEAMQETLAVGLAELRTRQFSLGRRVRELLAANGFQSVAAPGFEAPGVVVCYTDDTGIHNGSKWAAEGLQTAGGVPLMCDEPPDYKTFRIGLFGLDKLGDVNGTVARLERALVGIRTPRLGTQESSQKPATHQAQILARLVHLVDESKLTTDPDDLATFGRDWTKQWEPRPLAIVFPKSTAQVAAIVKLANELAFGLVPSGGRTGLSGGAVAANGEVVVAFDYMNQIFGLNHAERTVHCEAGVITQQLQAFAEDHGLFYPVDFASAGSSQVGGNLSTNAGGIKVLRYGMTRDWVAGLTVVTGTGEVLRLNKGLVKNATGYDLRHLFVGAEGTLGFITEATMKLTRKPKDQTVMVLGVPELGALMQVLGAFQQVLDLTAFEFLSDKALGHVLARGGLQKPFATPAPFYALLEIEVTSEHVLEEAHRVFEDCVGEGWVVDGTVSQTRAQAKALWRLREDISESIAKHTPYKNDISVTVSKVPAFLQEIDAIVAEHYPTFEIIWFGHIGDGNLHLNILKPTDLPKEEFFAQCATVNQWVFEAVQRHDGSISAEHGVGLVKRDYLTYSRSPEEIALLREIKAAFDPNGVMNPGKMLA